MNFTARESCNDLFDRLTSSTLFQFVLLLFKIFVFSLIFIALELLKIQSFYSSF